MEERRGSSLREMLRLESSQLKDVRVGPAQVVELRQCQALRDGDQLELAWQHTVL